MDSKKPDNALDMVIGFVEKCGGPGKVRKVLESMQGVARRGECGSFLFRVSQRSEGGAEQVVAAAIAGFSMSLALYEGSNRKR